MSHSLHRRGDVDLLKRDWVVVVTPVKGVDNASEEAKQSCIAKVREICEINAKYVVNMGATRGGCLARGASVQDIKDSYDRVGVTGLSASVMTSREAVKACLQELRDRKLGVSICVSGLIEDIFDLGREIDMPPHSVLLSLGVWGRRELLPPEDVLTITAMCGHHMLAPQLVEKVASQVRAGTLSIHDASAYLARPCTCGAINPVVVADVLQKMVTEGT